ncbi:MAG: osmotically inducible protein OsmC [Gammaproteobacteria bacterium]|nr:osmotically inducible protein OsmC [Gammaproteobacteria bacterium]
MSAIPLHYKTAYRWTGEGEAGETTIEGAPLLAVGSPHSTERYSPEHLLVVAAETCLANYVLVIAQMSQLEVKGYRSSAEGELVQEGEVEYRFSRVVIRPEVRVEAGKEEQTRRILEKAHQLCLVARSLSCPVEMEPTVLAE